jgi:hypothetical protein
MCAAGGGRRAGGETHGEAGIRSSGTWLHAQHIRPDPRVPHGKARSAARGEVALAEPAKPPKRAWAVAGVGAKCRLESSNHGESKATAIPRNDPAYGPIPVGPAAEERQGNPAGRFGQPPAEPAIRMQKERSPWAS